MRFVNNNSKINNILGHYSEGGTPVLIPNTEVKSFNAYGTAGLP